MKYRAPKDFFTVKRVHSLSPFESRKEIALLPTPALKIDLPEKLRPGAPSNLGTQPVKGLGPGRARDSVARFFD
jgi:hypothetical protein